MHNIRQITKNLIYIGCSDRNLSLFESAYPLNAGMAYNSYLYKGDKNILFDTVDKTCSSQFFENLLAALSGESLDYIVIHHMEPDHCALLGDVLKLFPDAKIICSAKTVSMINQFFDLDVSSIAQVVKDGESLKLGEQDFQFFMAPMVHWPEVMVTYDLTSNILFTADAFGSFGAINGNLYDSDVDWQRDYLDEARRYYTNIVGKYGMQVQMLLKKIANLKVDLICPLHGLLIKDNVKFFIEKYKQWSLYEPENSGVLFAYSSVYGSTENTVECLASKLADKGVKNIRMFDVSRVHSSYILSEAFKYSHIVIASTTYNAGIFETMDSFLNVLVSHNLQNRKFVIIQNGSWAPTCGVKIREMLENLKGTEILDDSLCVKSSLKEEQVAQLDNVTSIIEKSLFL